MIGPPMLSIASLSIRSKLISTAVRSDNLPRPGYRRRRCAHRCAMGKGARLRYRGLLLLACPSLACYPHRAIFEHS